MHVDLKMQLITFVAELQLLHNLASKADSYKFDSIHMVQITGNNNYH